LSPISPRRPDAQRRCRHLAHLLHWLTLINARMQLLHVSICCICVCIDVTCICYSSYSLKDPDRHVSAYPNGPH
jgi:hypothetical protein